MKKNILVLDDDSQRRTVHAFGLCCAGFNATHAAGTQANLTELLRHRPDLVLLFADRLDAKTKSFIRVLVDALHARRTLVVAVWAADAKVERDAARELGLHDCLAGPVEPQLLVDSVHNWLNSQESIRVLRCGLEFDIDSGVLTRDGVTVTLAPTERLLLAALIEQPERVLSREHLMRSMRGVPEDPSRLIDISVCRLRRSLKQLNRGDLLQTIRGRGYRISLRENTKAHRSADS